MQRAARAPGLKTAIVIRPVITQPVTGMAETALVILQGTGLLQEVGVPGILELDSTGSLVEE